MFSTVNPAVVTASQGKLWFLPLSSLGAYQMMVSLWVEGPSATSPDQSSPVLPPSPKEFVFMARVSKEHGVGH